MKQDLTAEIEIPEGVEVDIRENGLITVKGPGGQNQRVLRDAKVGFDVADGKVRVFMEKGTKREKTRLKTYERHINNMIVGVTEGFTYKLKICSGHFPMNVSVSGNKLTVKNFIGEKNPRVLTIREGANVKVDGDMITVTGTDREVCGQVAASIETLTRITNKDRRVFQDGIYITEKCGKAL